MSENCKEDISRKPEDLAYLAGYIDADGYIGFSHCKTKNEYRPVLVISASRRDILEELHIIANFGGHISTNKRYKTPWRESSNLIYSHQKACKVCEMVQPYLRLKGAQAALLIQIGAFRRKHPNGRGFNHKAYYIPRYEEIRRLNAGNKSDDVRCDTS